MQQQILLSVAATHLPEGDFSGSVLDPRDIYPRLSSPANALVENACSFFDSLDLECRFISRPEVFGNDVAFAHLERMGCAPLAHFHLGAQSTPRYFKNVPNFAQFVLPPSNEELRAALTNFAYAPTTPMQLLGAADAFWQLRHAPRSFENLPRLVMPWMNALSDDSVHPRGKPHEPHPVLAAQLYLHPHNVTQSIDAVVRRMTDESSDMLRRLGGNDPVFALLVNPDRGDLVAAAPLLRDLSLLSKIGYRFRVAVILETRRAFEAKFIDNVCGRLTHSIASAGRSVSIIDCPEFHLVAPTSPESLGAVLSTVDYLCCFDLCWASTLGHQIAISAGVTPICLENDLFQSFGIAERSSVKPINVAARMIPLSYESGGGESLVEQWWVSGPAALSEFVRLLARPRPKSRGGRSLPFTKLLYNAMREAVLASIEERTSRAVIA